MLHLLATPDQMAQLLVAARRQAGLTQAEAAARLGVSQSRISALETDAAALTLAQLLARCGAYGLQLQVLDKTQPGPARAAPPAADRAHARGNRAGLHRITRTLSRQSGRADFQRYEEYVDPTRQNAAPINMGIERLACVYRNIFQPHAV